MLTFLRHGLLWLVALSILNTSIDQVEAGYDTSVGNADAIVYNEIESIAELLLDGTMDQSLPDQKGNDQQGLLKKAAGFDFSLPEKKQCWVTGYARSMCCPAMQEHYLLRLPSGYASLFTPPPDRS